MSHPEQDNSSRSIAASSEWKKPAITGGIIGLCILVGALVLKGQSTPSTPVATTPTPTPTVTTTASPTSSPVSAVSASTRSAEPTAPEPAAPEKAPVSAEEAAKAEAGTDATIVGDAGSKNVRSGPGTKYDSPHMAYPGDRIKVMATSRDEAGYTWHKVYFPKSGAEGWVAAQLLRMDSGSSAPVTTATKPDNQPSPKPVSNAETNATIVGREGSKNVRSGPGTNYSSPHMAYPGDRVKILETTQDKGGFTWYKVYFPKSGVEGWMAAQLISMD
jgi:serine/threonine protein kinase, bacterial